MKTTLAKRRKFFDKRKDNISSKEFLFSCPCCGYPTLKERGGYNICQICNWEDDGQDDFDADIIRGRPNHLYSLTDARQNFEKYLVMYPPEKDTRIGGADSENVRNLKLDIIATFDRMIEESSPKELGELWQKIIKIKNALRQDVLNRIKEYEAKIKAGNSERN